MRKLFGIGCALPIDDWIEPVKDFFFFSISCFRITEKLRNTLFGPEEEAGSAAFVGVSH